MSARLVLGLSVALWLPYGLYCFANPEALAGIAGVRAESTTGSIELRAMYGGLQLAIGALALAGLLRESFRRPALVALVFLAGGLFVARAAAAAFEGELSSYTLSGLGFELVTVALASWVLPRATVAA
jgi:hypothetical protein